MILGILLCTTGLKRYTQMQRELKDRYKSISKQRAYLKKMLELVEIDYSKVRREVLKDTSLSSDAYSDLIHEVMREEEEGKKQAEQEHN